jgi:hypothetical protein
LLVFAFLGALRLERFMMSSLYAGQACPDRLAFSCCPSASQMKICHPERSEGSAFISVTRRF